MQSRPVTMPSPSIAFPWGDHHFVAGSPALDFTNAVVYRLDPARREDRFRHPGDVNAWTAAAGLAVAPVDVGDMRDVIAAREAINAFFRLAEGTDKTRAWRRLIRLYARQIAGLDEAPRARLPALILHEAVSLRFSPWHVRIKTCGGCGWLFVDRTRNASRRWCISALCGNRDKARRHYHRKKGQHQAPERPV